MEAGRIIEEGSHAELLAIPNGAYQRFYSLQDSSGVEARGARHE
jgi:ABC-type multidrug transport system fused ATPase/permease subunit